MSDGRQGGGRWRVRLFAILGVFLITLSAVGWWLSTRVLDSGGFADVVTLSSQRREVRDYIADQATLRLALCGTGARTIDVTVNNQPAGRVDRLLGDGAIARHSIQGLWYERELAFDASLMTKGTNVLKLIVPAGPVNNGVIYDYLRLELDESSSDPGKK